MENLDEKLKKIEEILSRGVGEFIDPDGKFKEKLVAKAKGEYAQDIIIKFGVDPTRPDIHLGHAVVLRKLRMLQDLGCKIIFLIGDFTAHIGDPTGKSKVRPEVEQKEIEHNMMTYLEQVDKIIRTTPDVFSWIRNSDWFFNVTDIQSRGGSFIRFRTTLVNPNSFVGKAVLFEETRMQRSHLKRPQVVTITLLSLLNTLRRITHSQLIERDMFKKRLENQEELFMHEMLYPVLQGIDSHALHKIYNSCDLEVGGTDQTFNKLVGRDVMKMHKEDPQAVLAFKLLEGIDGSEKMSKSMDNYIGITDEPFDMYGKVMSIPDTSIANYFELCTFTPLDHVEEIKKGLKNNSLHPKEVKMDLALQIVTIYYGMQAAEKAKENFIETFNKGGVPEDVQETNVSADDLLSDVLINNRVITSKSEWRRLVQEGAVYDIDNKKTITDPFAKASSSRVIKVGKRRFLRIKVE